MLAFFYTLFSPLQLEITAVECNLKKDHPIDIEFCIKNALNRNLMIDPGSNATLSFTIRSLKTGETEFLKYHNTPFSNYIFSAQSRSRMSFQGVESKLIRQGNVEIQASLTVALDQTRSPIRFITHPTPNTYAAMGVLQSLKLRSKPLEFKRD